MKFIPRAPQEKMIRHALKYAACAIWASMGLGKTSAMLYVAALVLLIYGGPVLIIAPKKVAKKTWPDEFKKFDQFKPITFLNFAAPIGKRKKLLGNETDVYIINYSNVRWFENNILEQFSLMIIDESTRIKKFRLRKGSKRAKAVLKLRKRSERVVELTGIPAPNGIMDLWGQIFILDFGKRLGRTLSAFRDRWFSAKFKGTHVDYMPLENSVTEVSARVKDICLSIRSEDYFDLEEVIEMDVRVDLPASALKIYKELEKHMYARLESGSDIDVVNKADLTLKCLQCTSGAIYTDPPDNKAWDELHAEKLDALESIVEEAAGAPILVCYHFRHELPRILKKFPVARMFKTEKDQDDWNEGKIPVMLIHPASAAHGLNLQYGGNIIVYYTQWWDFELDAQVFERIGPMRQLQAGFKRNVFRYNIIAENTIDERVKMARKHKLSIDQAIKREVIWLRDVMGTD